MILLNFELSGRKTSNVQILRQTFLKVGLYACIDIKVLKVFIKHLAQTLSTKHLECPGDEFSNQLSNK